MLIVLGEFTVVAVAFFVGASFWAVGRAPGHLRLILNDFAELGRIIRFLDPAKLREEAQRVEPAIGFARSIAVWDRAHVISLRTPRNLLLIAIAGDLFAGYFLPRWCLVAAVAVFVLPALLPVPASVINTNVDHIHTIILNLIKWHEADSAACELYCENERPDLSVLHALIVTMPEE